MSLNTEIFRSGLKTKFKKTGSGKVPQAESITDKYNAAKANTVGASKVPKADKVEEEYMVDGADYVSAGEKPLKGIKKLGNTGVPTTIEYKDEMTPLKLEKLIMETKKKNMDMEIELKKMKKK